MQKKPCFINTTTMCQRDAFFLTYYEAFRKAVLYSGFMGIALGVTLILAIIVVYLFPREDFKAVYTVISFFISLFLSFFFLRKRKWWAGEAEKRLEEIYKEK